MAAYDGHSYPMWDTAAVFCFKRSQPVLQFALVIEQRPVFHSALVWFPPFKNVRIRRTSRQGSVFGTPANVTGIAELRGVKSPTTFGLPQICDPILSTYFRTTTAIAGASV